MEEIKQQFTPFIIAIALVRLGFKKPCIASYVRVPAEGAENATTERLMFIADQHRLSMPPVCGAPLWQQGLDFFEALGYRFGLIWDDEFDKYWFDVWKWTGKHWQFKHETEIIYTTSMDVHKACLEELIKIEENERKLCS
jgi:hypothetical protein